MSPFILLCINLTACLISMFMTGWSLGRISRIGKRFYIAVLGNAGAFLLNFVLVLVHLQTLGVFH